MMKTMLVTGGAGFIGGHLCEALLKAGYGVRVLDDLSSGKEANVPNGAAFIQGSIADPDRLEEAASGADGIFHLAAIASVSRCVQDWRQSSSVNGLGAIAVMELAATRGLPLCYASSAAVYGDAELSVESLPPRPLSQYGADKLYNELQARAGHNTRGLASTGLRFFNVYGPRQDPRSPYSGVISIFADRATRGVPITIDGEGTQERDFIFVRDVVSALMAGFDHAARKGDASIFNVCTGRGTSILTLAQRIAAIAGHELTLSHGPARVGDIRRSIGDSTLMQRHLNVVAQTSLDAGLRETLTA